MFNIESVKEELRRHIELKNKIERILERAPKGHIIFPKAGNSPQQIPYYDYYEDGKRHRVSLKGKDPALLKGLLFKRYAKAIYTQVENNLKILKTIEAYRPFTEKIKQFEGDIYKECREHFFGPPVSNPEFEALKERQNPYHPEHLNVRSEFGLFRSREELAVARAMSDLGLRFKYEIALPVGMYCRYPDFAVLHPETGTIIYIEYAGKPADPGYQKDLQQRLRDYANVGVYLGVNLFILAPPPGGGFDLVRITEQLKGIFGI